MKFPILIHLMNNKANHSVDTVENLPRNVYFKILDRQFTVDNKVLDDVPFRRIEPETPKEVVVVNDEAQEDTGSSESNSEGCDSGSGSEDSISPSV